MPLASQITAILGPTNTGKTHRAVGRMLEHASGMIGLPLRLLAREVYDRITSKIGESRVALVTGEEKRVPPKPEYWVCTVEAMPTSIEVDFLAIDEVQLAADDQRGHVFTDRVLRSRGAHETWFLGSSTMKGVLQDLVPTTRFLEYPRLSKLAFSGAEKLHKLPPRSAVVGFSAAQVYDAAERIRARHGGAAVVFGALSPRTRNAQVAMFQAGEVSHIVATDAIGMGLNLDIDHVAFLALRKFDGRDVRELSPAELAQIAGRAGRHLTNGSFGSVLPLALPPWLGATIEEHRFTPIEKVYWRNPELDFSGIEALRASLRAPPRSRRLLPVKDAEDSAALARLVQDPEIARRARGEEAVSLLWEVCRIPDYRKLLFESHVALLGEVFLALSGPRAKIDAKWMEQKIAEVSDTRGDIDTLLTRIASIRTYTYIAHRPGWVSRASMWRARTRKIEDDLSDALHERLVARFVEKSGKTRVFFGEPRKGPRPSPAVEAPSPVAFSASGSNAFAALAMWRDAARSAVPEPAPEPAEALVDRLIGAAHDAFDIVFAEPAKVRITFEGAVLADLTQGTSLVLPEVRLAGDLDIGAGGRQRLSRRLLAFARDMAEHLVGPFRGAQRRAPSGPEKGLFYQLEQGLGTTFWPAGETASLDAATRNRLQNEGISVGVRGAFAARLWRDSHPVHRLALALVYFGPRAGLPLRPLVAPSVKVPPHAQPEAYAVLGYLVLGKRAVRADIVERIVDPSADRPPTDEQIASWLGCGPRERQAILSALSGKDPPDLPVPTSEIP